jgi:Bacterial membrane protein YfhO
VIVAEDSGRVDSALVARARRLSPETWAVVAIVVAVIVGNLPYLLDFLDPNPLGPRSSLLSSVVFGPAAGQPTIDPNNGFISQAVSHRAVIDLLHLHLPWWNPFEGTGAPLAGEMQSAALFPLTLLTGIANGQLYEHMLLELIAGLATYRLLRRLALSRPAAIAGGVAFALNGTFAWFSHAAVNPVAFLPLLLLGIERAYAAALAGEHGGWWLIAFAGALSFYAGFPEGAYIDTLLAVAWFAWRCGCAGRSRLKEMLAKGGLAAAVGALLSAPLLIAMIDYFNHADLGRHGTSFFASGHIPAHGLSQLVLPYVFGPIFGYSDPRFTLTAIWGTVGGYLTTSLLLFAVLGLIARRHRGLRLILLGWIVLAVARMYGGPPGLDGVLGLLPGMSRVAFFRYATPSVELAVIVLAAIGLDDLSAPAGRGRTRVVLAGVGVFAAVAAAAIAAHPLASALGSKFARRPYFAGAIAWGMFAVIAGVVIALLRDSRRRGWLAAALVAVDALLMFAIPEASAPRAVRTDLAPVAFLEHRLGESRVFTLGPLQPNYGAYFGLGLLDINDVPVPSAFARYIHARLDQVVDPTVFVGNLGGGRPLFAPSPQQELLRNLAGYRAAAVKYVLTPRGQILPPGPFRLVFQSPSTSVYALNGSAAYFSVSGRGCRVTSDARTAAAVRCAGPGRLVRRETFMPGWSATVDGHAVPVHEVEGLFQAVDLGAGTHRVSFSFTPPNLGWGVLAFVAGLALWLGSVVAQRRRARTG